MFSIKDVVEIIEKFENPIAWGMATVLAFFLVWRRFTTTEYVTAGKTAFESLNQLCGHLQIEIKLINEQLDQCLLTNKTLKTEIEEIKKIQQKQQI